MAGRRTRALVALARGAVKRCPRCGRGRLFTRWFTMPARCPRCRLAFERSEGFWLGAMAVNLGVTEAVFGAFFVTAAVLTWPHVHWVMLTVAGVAVTALIADVFCEVSST